MKKLFLVLLSVCLFVLSCTALTACGNGNGDGGDGSVADKETWESAIADSNFQNVTFTVDATFYSGYEAQEHSVSVMKLTSDKALADGELMTDEESVNSLREWYVSTTVALINNFEDFEYDSEKKCYFSEDGVVYDVTIMDFDAKITATNISVTLDSDMNIAKIDCDMKQEFSVNGAPVTYVLHTEFTFSDYGKTVI